MPTIGNKIVDEIETAYQLDIVRTGEDDYA